MSYKENLKHNLDQLMKKHNVTNEILAEKTGISRSSINRIRMNKGNPTVETLLSICDYFNVSLQNLTDSIKSQISHTFSKEKKIDLITIDSFEIPIIQWDNLLSFLNSENFINREIISDLYAVLTPMDYSNIPKNSMLIISKNRKPAHGNFILVQENQTKIINVAEYVQDISGEYIKSCLAEKLGAIDTQLVSLEKFKIIGVILESRKVFISLKEHQK